MNFIDTWFISMIVCTFIDIKGEFNIYKYIADKGYKLNLEKYREESNRKEEGVITINLDLIFKYLPFLNIGYSLFKLNFYNEKFDLLFEQLCKKDLVKKMTDEEFSKYLANPTGRNAKSIFIEGFKFDSQDSNLKKYEINSNGETILEKKPLSKLERYRELRDSLKINGYLYGEEMFEYKELKEEIEGPTLTIKKEGN